MSLTGSEWKVLYVYDGEEAIPLGKARIDGEEITTILDDILSPKASDLLVRNNKNVISVGIDGDRIVVDHTGHIRRLEKE